MRTIIALCTLALASASAQEWNQWRGPTRDATIPASSTPRAWPATLQRAWRVEIGEGYSSPVISGSRVFVHGRRDPHEVITAVDLATGKVLWQQTHTAPFDKNQYARSMAKGPHATPLVAGGRLYTLGVTGVLTAWNVQDGSIAWRKDYSASVDTSKLFCGTATSPIIEAGVLVVQVGSDVHGGRVMALDPATGAERWTWRGAGPGYASPAIITAGGVRQIVTHTNGSLEGIDAKTGAALWSLPFPDEWHENIVTPLWTGTHLVVSGTRQGTQAYTLAATDGRWRATLAWKNADVGMYMSTPVFADGVIYGHSSRRKGQLVALNAADGALLWATTGREGDHASVLLTASHVLFLTSDGTLILARRSPKAFEEERRYKVADSQTFAMPVVLADGVLVRDATGLARLTSGG
jgi:outer membrane protein assembly factor BamB